MARLVFLAFLGLTGSIIYNALYLQDMHGPAASSTAKSSTAKSSTTAPRSAAIIEPVSPAPTGVLGSPPVSTDLPPLKAGGGESQLLVRAVQRELAARGFDVGDEDGKLSAKTRAAITAFESNQGLPVTGVATDELLRQILLGDSVKPAAATGSLEAALEAGATAKEAGTVKAVQQTLADLGYAPGPVDGQFGKTTASAISAFQRDRKIPETGSISPELLSEIKHVTGRDPTQTAAKP